MLSLISPYKWVIEGLLALALLAGITYGVHLFLENEQKKGYDKAVAEYTAKQLIAEQAAREKEAQLNTQLQKAQNDATLREQQIKTLTDAVAANSVQLRDTVSHIRNGLPAATVDALRKTADAALSVFGECQARYAEVAKDADGHANDVKTLEEAWPK